MPRATVEIRRVRTEAERAAAATLRHEVFCLEQGVSEYEEFDGRDAGAVHLVATEDEAVVATCRLLVEPGLVRLGRMAVVRSHRRRGIALALLDAAEREVRSLGAPKLVLMAQTYARELYDKAGFTPVGDLFSEAGIEHIGMEKFVV